MGTSERTAAELERRARWLDLLASHGTRLLAEEHPAALIHAMFAEAAPLVDVECCFHFLAVPDGRLRLAVCRGVEAAACEGLTYVERGDTVCGAVAEDQTARVYSCVQDTTEDRTALIRTLGIRAYACFPLLKGSELLGTLSFGARTRDRFEPDELGFLRTLSDQIALAYVRAEAAAALRESEERLQQAVAIAELGTFDIDLHTDAVVVNAPGRAIYGWPADRPLTFDAVQRHFHPDDRERVMLAVQRALDPEGPRAFDVEQRIIRVDGAERWIRVRGRVVFEGRADALLPVRCLGTYLDITDRKRMDEQRERSLEAERAGRVEAERLGRLKDEFLATISHELRTPLNAILGWTQLLKRQPASAEDVVRAVDIIERNARAQAHLVDDLLDMSRAISGQIRVELAPLNLCDVVRSAVVAMEPAARAQQIELRTSLPDAGIRVSADPARFQQIVWNLLTNAIKFTPAGGRVEVSAAVEDHRALLRVADTGIGMSPEFLPHVFDPFRQEDASTTRRHAGVGLGLSIVKELVELHGGRVWVERSAPGEGSTFAVSLPLGSD